jgi:hypothetical protein
LAGALVTLLAASVLSTAISLIAWLAIIGGPSRDPIWLLGLVVYVMYWLPALAVLNVSAVLARRSTHGLGIRALRFYAFVFLIIGGLVAILFLIAPNADNRNAALQFMFIYISIPLLLSSLPFPLIALRRGRNAPEPVLGAG